MVRVAKLVAALTVLTMVFGVVMAYQLAHDLREARATYARVVGPIDHDAYRPAHDGPSALQQTIAQAYLPQDEELLRRPSGLRVDEQAAPTAQDALERLLSANAEALSQTRKASAAATAGNDPVWWVHPPLDPGNPSTEDLLRALRFARLLRLAAEDSLNRGNLDTALRYTDAVGMLAAALDEQPLFVAALFANVFHAQRLSLVRSLVADPRCNEACLAAIEHGLARTLPPSASKALAAEGAWLIGQIWPQATEPSGWRFLLFGGTGDEATFLDRWRCLVEAAERPYEDLDANLALLHSNAARHTGAIIARTLIPNLVDGIYKTKRLQAAHDIARAAIAARRAAFADGMLPTSLESSSISTAAQVTYRRNEDGSAHLEAPSIITALADLPYRQGTSVDPRLFSWTLPPPSAPSS